MSEIWPNLISCVSIAVRPSRTGRNMRNSFMTTISQATSALKRSSRVKLCISGPTC